MPKTKPKMFMSFVREDEIMKTGLVKALIMLKGSDRIEFWQDRA